jgi:hypothetical protein
MVFQAVHTVHTFPFLVSENGVVPNFSSRREEFPPIGVIIWASRVVRCGEIHVRRAWQI